jgi:hypothetical protein
MFGGTNNLALQGAQAGATGGQGIFDILRSLPWDKILKGKGNDWKGLPDLGELP